MGTKGCSHCFFKFKIPLKNHFDNLSKWFFNDTKKAQRLSIFCHNHRHSACILPLLVGGKTV